MARLQGVDLPREKRLEVALTYIYGIGKTRAAETLAATGISGDIRVKDLTDEQLVELRETLKASVGKDVQLATRVDPSLLGGLIVKVGSRMVDSSLKTKLANLRLSLRGV